MFDTLTRDDLYAYHSQLNAEGERLHKRFIALHSPLSEEAGIIQAECAEISETMNAVYAEIDRRNAEESAGACGLRDLRNQRGIDA